MSEDEPLYLLTPELQPPYQLYGDSSTLNSFKAMSRRSIIIMVFERQECVGFQSFKHTHTPSFYPYLSNCAIHFGTLLQINVRIRRRLLLSNINTFQCIS